MRTLHFVCSLLIFCASALANAEVRVRDDSGQEIVFATPARRIVSLAPYLTEILYAANLGPRIVATVDFSDYPAAARRLPRVGSYAQLDVEAIAAMQPDLVVVWQSGNDAAGIDKLRRLGLKLFLSRPENFEDIATSIERLGQLGGQPVEARASARKLRKRVYRLQQHYSHRPVVRLFYQVWDQPLMTVGGEQIIGKAIRLCGGENVFAHLSALAPSISQEAVIAANPEAIIAGGMGRQDTRWLQAWRQWPQIQAVAHNNLFFINPDILQRASPRLLDGTEQLCQQLEFVRAHRKQN